MHDAGVVCRDETGRDLPRQCERPRNRQPAGPAEKRVQVAAFHERHRDVADAVRLTDVVDADDVLVGDAAGDQQLLNQPAFRFLSSVARLADLQNLERDRNAEDAVPGLKHLSRAAGAQLSDDEVPLAEGLTGNGGAGRRPARCRRRRCIERGARVVDAGRWRGRGRDPASDASIVSKGAAAAHAARAVAMLRRGVHRMSRIMPATPGRINRRIRRREARERLALSIDGRKPEIRNADGASKFDPGGQRAPDSRPEQRGHRAPRKMGSWITIVLADEHR